MKKKRIALGLTLATIAGLAGAQDSLLARNLAATCANCHGTNGRSAGGIESLAGQSKDALVKKMQDFRSGAKPATVMHQLTKGYTDEQIDLIAGYFAAVR